jgi:hypothetical protein
MYFVHKRFPHRSHAEIRRGTTEAKACVSQKWKESLVATIVAKGSYCVYLMQLVSECSNILLQKREIFCRAGIYVCVETLQNRVTVLIFCRVMIFISIVRLQQSIKCILYKNITRHNAKKKKLYYI